MNSINVIGTTETEPVRRDTKQSRENHTFSVVSLDKQPKTVSATY